MSLLGLTPRLCLYFTIARMSSGHFHGGYSLSPELPAGKSNNRQSSKEHSPFGLHPVSDSIEQIKLKIKNIESIIKEKGMKTPPPHRPHVSKDLSFDFSKMRQTASFTNDHSKAVGSTWLKGEQGQTESLIEKANESIRKSYQLSMKNKLDQSDTSGTKATNLFKTLIKSPNGQNKTLQLFSKKYKDHQDFQSKSFVSQSNTSPVKNKTGLNNQTPKEMTKSWFSKKSNPVIEERENILPTYLKQLSRKRASNGFLYGRMLGKGKFGEVFLAQHIETGFLVAIKKVSKVKIQEYNMVNRFIEEINLHTKLDHPNIVKFYGFFEEKDNICLVLEYLNGGTLFEYMNQVGTLSMKEAVGFLREVIEALDYVHEKGICHRDIKPENIIISSQTGLAKLCDFGWSAVTGTPRETFCGTLDYASPQIIERRPYNESVDVWCVGVLTYEMFVGRAPFENSDRSAVMAAILNIDKTGIPFINTVPPEAQEFIEALLVKDPTQRPKMFQLLLYPLFQLEQNTSKRSLRANGH